MTSIAEQILSELEQLPSEMQAEALDFIHFLKSKLVSNRTLITETEEPNGKKVAEIMERIATRSSAYSQVKDPVKWQREIRKDRPLPGRDN